MPPTRSLLQIRRTFLFQKRRKHSKCDSLIHFTHFVFGFVGFDQLKPTTNQIRSDTKVTFAIFAMALRPECKPCRTSLKITSVSGAYLLKYHYYYYIYYNLQTGRPILPLPWVTNSNFPLQLHHKYYIISKMMALLFGLHNWVSFQMDVVLQVGGDEVWGQFDETTLYDWNWVQSVFLLVKTHLYLRHSYVIFWETLFCEFSVW